ncbi:MAG: hypothetical protein GDA39_06560 [Hyphomonadaceae bacterium]|nr:hypothetical protein [Hyphomonadaceae bacterium]MBC6412554.1 hypothetical protein [Hyphomonadaceae bacterium]
MQYLTYPVILVALYAGYAPFHPVSVVILALVSMLALMSARRAAMKDEPHRLGASMILDGIYLFAGQALIMFASYLLGWFMANRVTLTAA